MAVSKRSAKRIAIAFLTRLPAPSIFLLASAILLCSGPMERASAQEGNGGIFSSIFGGWSSSPRSSSRSRYDNQYPYGQSTYGYWNDSYSYGDSGYSRYRTLCVRTCDGYYFPISFSTTRASLARDAQRCESSCGVPAKLFYHRNPGADVQHMVDLNGRPYSSLENAFRYREELVENCRCTPEPWSEAAKQEYERRAEAATNPDQVQTADVQPDDATTPDVRAEVAGWRSSDYTVPAQERPSRRRNRSQADDSETGGRWWANAW